MTHEETLVAVALNLWNANIDKANKVFAANDLVREIAPGRNRLVYLLGHLTAMHDRMIALLDLGPRLHPELDATFLSSPDKASQLPPVAELQQAWSEVNARLRDGFSRLSTSDWLSKHTSVSAEDFAKDPLRNRFSILLTRTSHLSHHLGQIAIAPSAA